MTAIREISRNGALPDGVVDGFCLRCRGDVPVAPPDYRCPDCDTPVAPDSLPRAARIAALDAQPAPTAPETAPKSLTPVAAPVRPDEAQTRTVTLAPTWAAVAWSRATDALVAEAERDEAAALADYERAKARYQQAKRQANTARQLRVLVQVDGAAALPEPARKQERDGSQPTGRWSRNYDACRICGTTERVHMGKGRCSRCWMHQRKYGHEWPHDRPHDRPHKKAPNEAPNEAVSNDRPAQSMGQS